MMKTRMLDSLDSGAKRGREALQVVDEEHAKEIHQQCADAEAQEAQKRDWVAAEAPVEVALLRLEGLLFHGEGPAS